MNKAKKELKRRQQEYRRRVGELDEIRSRLHCAYSAFDKITDKDELDACIFEISALKSRYNCAVINIRNLN